MVIACLVDDVAHKYGSTCLVSAYGGLRGAICRDCTVLVILIYDSHTIQIGAHSRDKAQANCSTATCFYKSKYILYLVFDLNHFQLAVVQSFNSYLCIRLGGICIHAIIDLIYCSCILGIINLLRSILVILQ
jgi:hypothetical protein